MEQAQAARLDPSSLLVDPSFFSYFILLQHDFINRPDHVERALGNVLEFIFQDALTAVDAASLRLTSFPLMPLNCSVAKKGLRQKTFQSAGPRPTTFRSSERVAPSQAWQ